MDKHDIEALVGIVQKIGFSPRSVADHLTAIKTSLGYSSTSPFCCRSSHFDPWSGSSSAILCCVFRMPRVRFSTTNIGSKSSQTPRTVPLFQLEYFAQQYINAPNAFCLADRRHRNSIETTESGASRQRLFMVGKNRTRPLALGLYRSIKPLHTPSGTPSMQLAFLRYESLGISTHG